MLKITCAGCGKQLEAPEEAAGGKGKCPECDEVFTIPAAASGPHGSKDAGPADEKHKPEEDKAIEAECSNCGEMLKIPRGSRAAKTVCPNCGTAVQAPENNGHTMEDAKDYSEEIMKRIKEKNNEGLQ